MKAGVLALHRAEYRDAEALLAGALTSGQLPAVGAIAQEARRLLDLARGEQRALGPAIRQVSPDGHVEIVCADARDAILAPYLFSAMAEARAALGGDFGVLPGDPVSASRSSTIPPSSRSSRRSRSTTSTPPAPSASPSTGEVIMVSPRVLLYGYS